MTMMVLKKNVQEKFKEKNNMIRNLNLNGTEKMKQEKWYNNVCVLKNLIATRDTFDYYYYIYNIYDVYMQERWIEKRYTYIYMPKLFIDGETVVGDRD